MLNENERERIRLEECYRQEVREQFSGPKEHRWLKFFNSNLGIWLLSAIVISGVGSLVTVSREWYVGRQKTQESIERLDLELGYRFSQVQSRLYAVTLLTEAQKSSETQIVLNGLDTPSARHLFPEYAAFSVPALVAELRRLESCENRPELEQALAHLSGLPVFLEVRKSPASHPEKVAGSIIADLVLPRWKTGNWYFLDGSREQPFP